MIPRVVLLPFSAPEHDPRTLRATRPRRCVARGRYVGRATARPTAYRPAFMGSGGDDSGSVVTYRPHHLVPDSSSRLRKGRTMTVRMMDPYCERHGTWHEAGACATIDALRASLTPRMVDQLDLFDPPPTVLCVACGATVDGDESFCDRCEATIRVAEHVGRTNGLTAQQRDVLGIGDDG